MTRIIITFDSKYLTSSCSCLKLTGAILCIIHDRVVWHLENKGIKCKLEKTVDFCGYNKTVCVCSCVFPSQYNYWCVNRH
jgi:hypothetical protein